MGREGGGGEIKAGFLLVENGGGGIEWKFEGELFPLSRS